LSFLYPLSYVAAFLPQVFAVVRWAYLKSVERRSEGRIVLWGLGAYAAATLLHPYFPKNLTFFYVQNIYVTFLELTQRVNLHLANELTPLDTRQLVGAHLPLLAQMLALAFALMHRRVSLSERTRVTFPIAAILILMTCLSKRFVEYSVPVATLFCAFLYTDLSVGYGKREYARDFGTAGKLVVIFWLICLCVATGVEASYIRGDFTRVGPPRFQELARSLAAKAPPGEIVYACDWDEPPELFFYDDQYRYPVMMDPTFMYYWDPKIWGKWSDASNGLLSADETRKTLLETFHTRYGVCGAKFGALRALMGADARFSILAENKNGYVFEVR